MFSSFSVRVARRSAPLVPLLACLLSGCTTDGYPRDLKFPPRHDLIVIKPPEGPAAEPFYPDSPGQLDQLIAQIEKQGGKTLDPRKVNPEHQAQLRAALAKVFGTPARPTITLSEENNTEAADQALDDLKLDVAVLRKGSVHYRRHCLHCHGLSGDGRGPTGPWVNPHPRDYRQGVFKFISTSNDLDDRKPRRADLHRTLEKGIDGTSMPAFGLLPTENLNAMVSYVIYLSVRGQVEYEALKVILDGGPEKLQHPTRDTTPTVEEFVEAWAAEFLVRWNKVNTTPPNTPASYPLKDNEETKAPPPESIVRGYRIFTNPEGSASCIGCHKDFGRQVNFRYDAWGTLVRPRDLTAGQYRGGRRPIDFYWRITGGIPPSGMPAAKNLKPEEYWDLINFVQALPYPQMLPAEIRDKVYVPERRQEGHPPEHAVAP